MELWRAELVVKALFLTFEIQTVLFVSVSYTLLTSKIVWVSENSYIKCKRFVTLIDGVCTKEKAV